MTFTRRDMMASASAAAAGTAATPLLAQSVDATGSGAAPAATRRRGFDNQRVPDLGNGTFLNPIMAGDHPDPSILKDGKDYYMTFSTFDSYPGLIIWHSRDLVNWTPLTAALTRNIGSVWAPELCKHKGRYYLYVPVKANPNTSYVMWADKITGPWSEPIDLVLPNHIDPGHAVGEDGSRWLFLSGGDRIRLSDDGLKTIGAVEHVYDPWRYPDTWDVEGFAPEGPKVTRHGDYFYLVTAVGGTAGPPTGHMVIAARSRSINGPWEHHPRNPLVHTTRIGEKWWSRGHATLVEGPGGDWWSVYHGFENGFWTLGRQTLLDPIRWTDDGWFEMTGGDLSQPIAKPGGGSVVGPHGLALSDDFRTLDLGRKWNFFAPGPDEAKRATVKDGALLLHGSGVSPRDSSPLVLIAGDRSYQFECDIELAPGTTAGLLLFYDKMLYCGLGFDEKRFVTHQYGIERGRPANAYGRRMRMRVTNREHIVSYHLSAGGGKTWERFDRGMEVSGYHHNVRGGFLMLRPGLYAAGNGTVAFRNFVFRAL
ncbi:family 43 glycosylhydrolase [Sphingomonas sanxanigenens]|nr:family 43 glycosylhydrolase [Sphingomonas sanxanigenens]